MSHIGNVTIAGENWPTCFNYSAIRRTLPLFGLSYIADTDKLTEKMQTEFPADAMAPFIQIIIRSGLRMLKDEREVPTVQAIEDAIDEDMGLISEAVNSIVPAETKPAKKGKPGTSKQSL